MSSDESFITLAEVQISSMWPLGAGSYVYEGCSKLLSDGRPCALGKHKRRLRSQDPESPMGPFSRGRVAHVCDAVGSGTSMFCFAIKVGDKVIQVNDLCGKKLMGITGEEFKSEYDGSYEEIEKLCDKVMQGDWRITYVRDDRDVCKAVTVNRVNNVVRMKPQPATAGESSAQLDDIHGDLVISLKSIRIKHEK